MIAVRKEDNCSLILLAGDQRDNHLEKFKKWFKTNFLVFYSIQITIKHQGRGVGTRPNTSSKIQAKAIEIIFSL